MRHLWGALAEALLTQEGLTLESVVPPGREEVFVRYLFGSKTPTKGDIKQFEQINMINGVLVLFWLLHPPTAWFWRLVVAVLSRLISQSAPMLTVRFLASTDQNAFLRLDNSMLSKQERFEASNEQQLPTSNSVFEVSTFLFSFLFWTDVFRKNEGGRWHAITHSVN